MAKMNLSTIVLLAFYNNMSISMREYDKTKEEVAQQRYRASDLFESCIKHTNQHKYCFTFYENNELKYPEQYNMFVKQLQLLEKYEYVDKKERQSHPLINPTTDRTSGEVVDYALTDKGKNKIRELFVTAKQKA